MKTLALALLTLLGGSTFAASTEPLFTPGEITLPPLTLRDSTRPVAPQRDPAQTLVTSAPKIPQRTRDSRFVFPPPTGVDYKLKVARPDPDVEYHLRLIDPEYGSRR